MKCFIGDCFFPFLGADFANMPPTFLSSHAVITRYSETVKYEQYLQDHFSGTKLRIWIFSEHDAVFNFHFIALCNLTNSFAFSFVLFLS